MRVFAVDSFCVRRLSAEVSSAYVRSILECTKKIGPSQPGGGIKIDQTPYFDLRDPAGHEGVLTALLEDDNKKDPEYDTFPTSLLASCKFPPWPANPTSHSRASSPPAPNSGLELDSELEKTNGKTFAECNTSEANLEPNASPEGVNKPGTIEQDILNPSLSSPVDGLKPNTIPGPETQHYSNKTLASSQNEIKMNANLGFDTMEGCPEPSSRSVEHVGIACPYFDDMELITSC